MTKFKQLQLLITNIDLSIMTIIWKARKNLQVSGNRKNPVLRQFVFNNMYIIFNN